MCDFKSYIELEDGTIAHLTDVELRDKTIRERLKGCQDNDLIGHGAIRKAFNITRGRDVEIKDFWNIEQFPKEIQVTLRNFDKYYSRVWSECFTGEDLCYIIEYAPEAYKNKAWKQLLKQKPSNDDLCCIIYYAPKAWKNKAWKQLLKQKHSNEDLRYIIYYAPEAWKNKAWEQLLKQEPSNDDLRCIIKYAPEAYKNKASKLLSNLER